MFDRRSRSSQHLSIAASAVLIVMSAAFTTPSHATSPTQLDCPDATKATLEVPADAFVTELVSHNNPATSRGGDKTITEIEQLEATSASSLLVPRAEAAIRNAFRTDERTSPVAGTDADAANIDDGDVEIDTGMNTRLPGISDADFARYKKRMYRRDI